MISFMDMLSVVNRTIFISLDNEINNNNNENENIIYKIRDNIISFFRIKNEKESRQDDTYYELNNLTKINIKNCRCFDPNEENNLKYVITAGDASLFEKKIGIFKIIIY
jgi:competence protein ComGF